MRPKKSAQSDCQSLLFDPELTNMINPKHELVQLAKRIDWLKLDKKFGAEYAEEVGSPGKPTRLMAGLQYLKYTYNLSDEQVVGRWLENPYWQYFCGERYFQHTFPIHPTSMTKWRQRMGEQGMETLLASTIETALSCKVVKPSSFRKINVDTTVQEKAITYPTDTKLLNKMRHVLVRMCIDTGIPLRQRYTRVGPKLVVKAARYFHARQTKKAMNCVRKVRTILGRVIRDIERKIAKNSDWLEQFKEPLELAQRIYEQKRTSKNKVYSIHEVHVECISKGKAHKKYEFGNKVGIVATSKEGLVIGAKSFHGNPYDGHTLKESLEQAAKIIKKNVSGHVFVDKGYRGHGYKGPAQVYIAGRKRLSSSLKKWLKRRSVIEATIGHLKQSSRLDRNYLKGKEGDRINAVLSACGWNLHLILAKLRKRRLFLCLFQTAHYIFLVFATRFHTQRITNQQSLTLIN